MKEFINELIEKYGGAMFFWHNEKLYLLLNHHHHLDPEDSRKVLIAHAPKIKEMRWLPSNRKRLAYKCYCDNVIKWK